MRVSIDSTVGESCATFIVKSSWPECLGILIMAMELAFL